MASFQRPRRVLVAVEMEDGSATVYQLHGSVTISVPLREFDFMGGCIEERAQVVAEGSFLEAMHRPASDYFNDRPAIEPERLGLNP